MVSLTICKHFLKYFKNVCMCKYFHKVKEITAKVSQYN